MAKYGIQLLDCEQYDRETEDPDAGITVIEGDELWEILEQLIERLNNGEIKPNKYFLRFVEFDDGGAVSKVEVL